jgi:sugar (pentulose or hexulose) kinase
VFTDWSEIHSFLQDPKVYEPDPNAHAIYNKSYQIYRDLYPETKASMEALAKLYE